MSKTFVIAEIGINHNGSLDLAKQLIDGDRLTIQEYLQEISGCDQHYSTGDTVAFHAIAFAIIMGCNPIM